MESDCSMTSHNFCGTDIVQCIVQKISPQSLQQAFMHQPLTMMHAVPKVERLAVELEWNFFIVGYCITFTPKIQPHGWIYTDSYPWYYLT